MFLFKINVIIHCAMHVINCHGVLTMYNSLVK